MYATTGLPIVVRDIATLVARVGLGIIFIAHGWQKFGEWTVAGTAQSFHQMGVPASDIAAPFSTYVELIGGALLILGALTPLVGALLAVNMIGAMILVHLDSGVFVDQGGWELVAALAAGALLLAAAGPGRLSLDQLIFRGRKKGSRKRSRSTSRAAADA
ncbi:putative oxidoreductase [Brevibacterium sanguinis]|uniref:Oxidoreductase n=2 Tax=Brevibacterium TaxID=1696 RepID=A0ABX9GQP2_9MICO|nr:MULTISPECIES: DoxX family protein [Brevibacterium]RBP65464.1 putative oxidoreductase [Brevibacterium sanguinis]RBP72098.1 putative oxidoreductase [Brevibacterium celere]